MSSSFSSNLFPSSSSSSSLPISNSSSPSLKAKKEDDTEDSKSQTPLKGPSNSSSSSSSLAFQPRQSYPPSSPFLARANPKYNYHIKRQQQNQQNLLYSAKMIVSSRAFRFTALAIFFLVVLVFIFSSSKPPPAISDSVTTTKGSTLQDGSLADSSSKSPFECTKSFDGKTPITQYVIMIDAGSSGSRVHIYEFNNCQSSPRLVSEEFKMLEPGLSSYKDDPIAAARSLDPLLDLALATIPVDYRGCTPIAVKATAGLRLIGEEAANRTLAAVRSHLEVNYPFAVVSPENDGVAIMPGADEGVYAWVTVNYLLGNIVSDPNNKIPIEQRPPTAAVFDLGGGSTQIVFEPRFKISGDNLPQGDHRYDIKFGANHYTLYQHSHLGYGLNVARESVYSSIVANYIKSGVDIATTPLVNPCLPPGVTLKDVKVKIDESSYVVPTMIGPKESSILQCQKIAETLLRKEAECPVEPCSFNGIYQPSLTSNFAREGDLYVISYFYDRTFPLGMPSAFNIDDLKDLAQKVCRGKDAYDSFEAIPNAVSQLSENPQWCGDLAYMLSVLHHGYDIPVHREVKIAKKVKGNELGWCLGASLPLLDQSSAGWSCRVTQQ